MTYTRMSTLSFGTSKTQPRVTPKMLWNEITPGTPAGRLDWDVPDELLRTGMGFCTSQTQKKDPKGRLLSFYLRNMEFVEF